MIVRNYGRACSTESSSTNGANHQCDTSRCSSSVSRSTRMPSRTLLTVLPLPVVVVPVDDGGRGSGSNGSTTTLSVPLISARQNGHPWPSPESWTSTNVHVRQRVVGGRGSTLTCHAVKHGVHSKWPHGSMRTSLSFSAHILHN